MEIAPEGREDEIRVGRKQKNTDTKIFSFDRIFQAKASQKEIFNEIKDDLISSAFGGVTIDYFLQ
jgi:hypothetical protein